MRTSFFIALAATFWMAETTHAADPASDAAKSYRIVTSESTASLKVGQKGRLVLVIEPLVERVHVNAKAPFQIKLQAPEGIKLEKEELAYSDATGDTPPRFEAAFSAVAAGRKEAKAKLDFYICSDSWCVKQTKNVSFVVDIK